MHLPDLETAFFDQASDLAGAIAALVAERPVDGAEQAGALRRQDHQVAPGLQCGMQAPISASGWPTYSSTFQTQRRVELSGQLRPGAGFVGVQ